MLQELSYLLQDNQPQICLGLVLEVEEGEPDQLLTKFEVLPTGNKLIAPVAWTPGVYEKPRVGDIALLVVAGRELDHAYAISFLPRTESGWLIPQRSLDGELSFKSRAGQKLNISSDTRINIGKGGETEEAEPLVLGLVLKEYLTALVTDIGSLVDHLKTLSTDVAACGTALNGLGATNSVPANVASLSALLTNLKTKVGTTDKNKYISTASTNILSQQVFTERGGS